MNYEDHDDLCSMKDEQWPKHPLEKCWQCDLIAAAEQRGRQDERFNALGTRVRELKPYADGYCDGERAMLAKCIEAVYGLDKYHHGQIDGSRALAALRELEEKP